jgi:glycosyltransferase involved in cell wall biosynthesis
LKAITVLPSQGRLTSKLIENGIETRILPLSSLRPWYLANVIKSIKSLYRICSDCNPALIYANSPRAAIYGGIAGKLLGIPMVWHCRVAEKDPYIDSVLARLSVRIIANSHATRKRFIKKYRHKINVIYNGIDIHWFRKHNLDKRLFKNKDWKIILVVARISRVKRHDTILEAFEKIAQLEPSMQLVCIGGIDSSDPDWYKYLIEKTAKMRSKKRVHWMGQIDDVRPWYHSAFMTILASQNEGFGRVVVESMAAGVPVVASSVGAITEIIRHEKDGLLFVQGDSKDLAIKVEKLIEDSKLRKKITKAGYNRAQIYSIENHVDKLVALFHNL